MAVLFQLSSEVNRSRSPELARQLAGLAAILGIEPRGEDALDAETAALVAQRDEARRNRDFAEADRLRDALQARGFEVRDTPEGTKVRRT